MVVNSIRRVPQNITDINILEAYPLCDASRDWTGAEKSSNYLSTQPVPPS